MGGVYYPRIMEKYIPTGMRFLLGGSDTSFTPPGARPRSKALGVIPL
jgi:hypothetical protein